MILNKWNYEKHGYDSYVVPDNWNVKVGGDNLDEIIHCASCGREGKFGDTYTSLEIHTPLYGFGYAVCEDCHNKEWERRRKHKDE